MKDFITFRKMISPILIQVLFWIAVFFFIVTAIIDILKGADFRIIFMVLILGPLVTRIICEFLIICFRIHDDLEQIKSQLTPKKKG